MRGLQKFTEETSCGIVGQSSTRHQYGIQSAIQGVTTLLLIQLLTSEASLGNLSPG